MKTSFCRIEKKVIRLLRFGCLMVLAGALAACGGGGDGGGVGSGGTGVGSGGTGVLSMSLSDAPACGYDAVNVTIQKVRVNQSSTAGDTDAGWSEIVLNPAMRVNLLTLTNGVLSQLGQTSLPAGKYTQLRLILADNSGANPLANSVVPTGGAEAPLKTPSGQQSGAKANIDINIAANQTADFVIDFDACKSVVVAGNSGQFLLKPVLKVVPLLASGVSGFVAPSLANGNTSLSLQQGGVVVKATPPDSTGKFLLEPVAPGSYSLVLTAPGRTTAIVTNVVVAANTVTALNASGSALNPPASGNIGTVKGNAPVNTLVSVLQPLTGGTPVEVASQFVDGTTGNYSYPLVVDAPLVAPFVAMPNSLVFAADTAAAGKYTLDASQSGFADKTATLPTLASNATITTNFTFP